MLERLGVSRPTLRQAARLLEAEQLLVVKRGLKGGLFARTPTSEGVAHIASVFLRSQGTTLADLTRTFYVVAAEVIRLAAANPDATARAGLLAWLDEQDAAEGPTPDRRTFARGRIEFTRQVALLTDSPTLRLFIDVLWDLGRVPGGSPSHSSPEQIAATQAARRAQAEAVRDGDVKRAVAASRASATEVLAWSRSTWGIASWDERSGPPPGCSA